ncbi:NTP_transferase domain-containing protein [Haematococcus lacustris]|uniref:glucose-1-phosphate adenylyltransferase n=1 Tax=Haematococcus lacustris TaxID=44745 RepID=A0A699YYJ4_HAELA|nr:NTP_transferase domain-containing protein [Haematococcus lacustris]
MFPLTEKRTLPAIPLVGVYRLIDIPLSSLLNSGVNKVFVLTQYNSTSLNRYLQHTYDIHDSITLGRDCFVEVVAATQV